MWSTLHVLATSEFQCLKTLICSRLSLYSFLISLNHNCSPCFSLSSLHQSSCWSHIWRRLHVAHALAQIAAINTNALHMHCPHYWLCFCYCCCSYVWPNFPTKDQSGHGLLIIWRAGTEPTGETNSSRATSTARQLILSIVHHWFQPQHVSTIHKDSLQI